MEVILAQPRGFCAGVIRAIQTVERALELYGTPVYVLHEIVHNRHVVGNLRKRGARFVEKLAEVPLGSLTIFSAHGVSTEVVREAQRQELRVIDATCPLVTKVHLQAKRYSRQGMEVIIIGHPGHPEVEGTRGRIEGPVHVLSSVAEVETLSVKSPDLLAYVTQTTLSMDDTRELIAALKQRFPAIKGPDLRDICYATQSRQNAVRKLAHEVDLLLVVGALYSSNSNRLREAGGQNGLPSFLIEDATDLDPAWLSGKKRIGITAGASTPEILVQNVLDRLGDHGKLNVWEMDGERETIRFSLPKSPLL
ncbi:MAG: 4-hydroxy-3-methylbut-2-enyl diphosphate reductase [Deltaproteobacteria bacterium]|nr:MAG: 4-hydroxy-3-methylbut-2-enyl diphosphate reductase [Deltaproteobacteria bacterium]